MPTEKQQPPASEDQADALTQSPDLQAELLDQLEQRFERVAIRVVRHEMHAGPMPSPKQFGEYDKALPGTAQAIRDEFQLNSAHVRTMEDRGQQAVITRDQENRRTAERLVWGAFVLIAFLASIGQKEAAIAVAVTTVVAVITGFLKSKGNQTQKRRNEEDEE